MPGARAMALAAAALLLGLAGCKPASSGAGDGGTDAGAAECQSRADCTGGLVCKGGQCVGCQRDRECKADEICNPVKQICEYRPCFGGQCQTHADCPLGQFCVQGLCRKPSGTTSDGCPGVTPCATTADCPEGFKCNPGTLVCEENVGCYGDAACPDGYYCNLATHGCEQSCTQASASSVCPATYTCASGRCVECTVDADCGAGLTCDATAGRCAGAATCFSDRDCVHPLVCNKATGQCTDQPPLCVSDADCLKGEVCQIRTGLCISAACLPDALEPNDTEASAAAVQPGLYSNLTLCGGQPDWFKLDLGAGDQVSLTVSPPNLAGTNFTTVLYDPTGTQALGSGSLQVDTSAPAAGTYPFVVRSTDARDDYTLRILVSRGTPCEDDAYEPDDSFTAAAPLDAGTHVNLMKCPNNADWYLVAVPRGQSLTATLRSDPTQGPLELDVYDSDGTTLLAKTTTTAPAEQVTVTDSSAGRVFLQVVAASTTQNAYDLDLVLQ